MQLLYCKSSNKPPGAYLQSQIFGGGLFEGGLFGGGDLFEYLRYLYKASFIFRETTEER